MRRRSIHCAWYWLTGLFILFATPVWADYKDDYQDGVKAAERGDWATTRRLMESALSSNSTAANRLRTYGVNFIEYVPHYYLGLALMNQGDCRAALSAFNNSSNKSVVSGDKASKQAGYVKQCDDKLRLAQNPPPQPPPVTPPPVTPPPVTPPVVPPVTPPVTPPVRQEPTTRLSSTDINRVRGALSSAEQQAKQIDGRLRSAPLAGTGDSRALSSDLRAAQTILGGLGSRVDSAVRSDSADQLRSAENTIKDSASKLRLLADRVEAARKGLVDAELGRELDRAKRRGSERLAQIDEQLAEAKATGLPDNASSALQQQRNTLSQSLAGNDANAITRTLSAVDKASAALTQALANAPKAAPKELRDNVVLFLNGDFQKVATWGAPDRLPENKDRAQGLLLRAAARLHVFVRGGEKDLSLRAAINADLREAKRLDSSLKPNPTAHSPRLIELFDKA